MGSDTEREREAPKSWRRGVGVEERPLPKCEHSALSWYRTADRDVVACYACERETPDAPAACPVCRKPRPDGRGHCSDACFKWSLAGRAPIGTERRTAEASPDLIALATKAAAACAPREGEDVDAWAERLAADSVAMGEAEYGPRPASAPTLPWYTDHHPMKVVSGGVMHAVTMTEEQFAEAERRSALLIGEPKAK